MRHVPDRRGIADCRDQVSGDFAQNKEQVMLVKKNRRPQVRTRAIFGTDIRGNPGIKLAFCLEERPALVAHAASKQASSSSSGNVEEPGHG